MRRLRCRDLRLQRVGVAALLPGRIPSHIAPAAPCRRRQDPVLRKCRPFGTSRGVSRAVVAPNPTPTIYALSTAPGRAAIAIVRISGTACLEIYRLLCPGKEIPTPRYASFRSIHSPIDATEILDSGALVLFFPGPATATGEDVLELHIHGGPAITKIVLSAIGECNSIARPVRYAEPGEFTRRAFLNGRLDLTQVEALGETLSAVTEEQRRLSVQSAGKGLSTRYESWRQLLLYARGELEALIDFAEDQHFDESPAELAASVSVQVRSLLSRLSYYSENAVRGELLRNGITISLVGAPNVGKSSLLNLIIGRNAAIVSKEAGTTRDIVEVGIDLGGYFCRLGDTAGLRRPQSANGGVNGADPSQALADIVGEIEQEGIRRTKARAEQSDLVIVVFSVEPSIQGQGAQLSLDQEVINTANSLRAAGKTVVAVVNKIDNYGGAAALTQANLTRAIQEILPGADSTGIFCISCKDATNSDPTDDAPKKSNDISANDDNAITYTADGNLQLFLNGLKKIFRSMTAARFPEEEKCLRDFADQPDSSIWQESLGATQRQRALLDECAIYLRVFVAQAEHANPLEADGTRVPDMVQAEFDVVVAAESLRAAGRCLEKILGKGEAGDVNEVLGVVFEKFCVGK